MRDFLTHTALGFWRSTAHPECCDSDHVNRILALGTTLKDTLQDC